MSSVLLVAVAVSELIMSRSFVSMHSDILFSPLTSALPVTFAGLIKCILSFWAKYGSIALALSCRCVEIVFHFVVRANVTPFSEVTAEQEWWWWLIAPIYACV